ncbi:hypothetical protein DLD82_00280 [Methanospirillum stamsii]|uniref:Uncharacterized protein n=1 Tax=Methanospirillum stamsii TaxID=1277351 RepID=A0A2V2NKY7_9EURY|nr:hypothetical protein DLD82_00280 [Methanospirillum stamsii]
MSVCPELANRKDPSVVNSRDIISSIEQTGENQEQTPGNNKFPIHFPASALKKEKGLCENTTVVRYWHRFR